MAYVIAVCGSGGKTTLVKNLAAKYANENKKVCITTTTHMWHDDDVKESLILGAELCGATKIENGKVYYISNCNFEKEMLTPLNATDYESICEKFDYVIIEADGSRSMPLKIPKAKCEPVIPDNVNEIIIVVGMESIGREIGAVCHRFNEFYGNDKYLDEKNITPKTIVTEELIDDFVRHYYEKPLKEKYSEAKIVVYKNYFDRDNAVQQVGGDGLAELVPTRVALVLLAAGFSKRFGENKLLVDIDGKRLYQLMIDKLIGAKEITIEKFKENEKYKNLQVDVVVVSQYDEILNDENYKDKVMMLKNDRASEGMSASIKIAVKNCDCDAVVFVNADMPYLPKLEIGNFVYHSIINKNGIGVMCSDDFKNPAYFEKEYFDELMKLEGDKGARGLLDKYKMKLYKYYIDDKYLIDIDDKNDLDKVHK